jgi:ABC-type transport system substrate-binding protein
MSFSIALAVALLGRIACAAEPAIVVVQPFLAGTLDPAVSTEAWALQSHGIAETLFTVAPDGTVVPQIAESAEAADNTSWTVRLHSDWRFSDGTPVDVAAVRASLLDGTERNPLAVSQTGKIEIDVLNPLTFRIRTAKPVPAMRSVLAEYFHVVHKWEGDRIVFTGSPNSARTTGSSSNQTRFRPSRAGARQSSCANWSMRKRAPWRSRAATPTSPSNCRRRVLTGCAATESGSTRPWSATSTCCS